MYQKYARLRDERNMTDYQVSKEIGASPATFSAWKRGEYTPKVDKLAKIAKLFNVSLETLLEG